MWEPLTPPSEDAIRQGDLLADAPLLRPLLPVHTTSMSANDDVYAPVKHRTGFALVVTQCCTAERERAPLSIVEVRRHGVPADSRDAYLAAEPSSMPGAGGYVYEHFALREVSPHLPELGRDRLWIAVLNDVFSYHGDQSELRKLRIARMTAEGRRLLRLNLMSLWGRATEDDAAVLAGAGLPPGPSSIPTDRHLT